MKRGHEGGGSLAPGVESSALPASASEGPLGGGAVALEVDGDRMEITPLGAGQEVGRSCLLLKFKGRTIMLDCGIHPGLNGINALPYFDAIDDASSIDLLLVSHFHLDHAASLPYFLAKSNFRGKVFMTRATKRIYRLLLSDFVRVSNISVDEMLYDDQDLQRSADRIEEVDFHQEVAHNGIKFQCYHAGHVLGAAMFEIEIGGVRILYTGDYTRSENRHLVGAEMPNHKPDVLIIESTFGIQILTQREDRERRFLDAVQDILGRGGRVLIPSFALGNTQELLLILEEHWDQHAELQHVPIYYASSLAKRCNAVYQECVHDMNESVRRKYDAGVRVFNFRHINYLKSLQDFSDTGPCVVLASPGMLQNGMSRELFERWCQNTKNGVIIPGYSVEGTLAKEILQEPSKVMTMAGILVPLRMSVHYVSFSAHADFRETSTFIDELMPPNIMLVHGESSEMMRLKSALTRRYEGKSVTLYTPANCDTLRLTFKGDKVTKIVGRLAAAPPADGRVITGLVVRKDFSESIVAPEELTAYTQLKTSAIDVCQTLKFYNPFALLRTSLSQLFIVEEIFDEEEELARLAAAEAPAPRSLDPRAAAAAAAPAALPVTLWVQRTVRITEGRDCVTLQWESNPVNDLVADAVVSLALHIEQNPLTFKNAVTREMKPVEEMEALLILLQRRFGSAVRTGDTAMTVTMDGIEADVSFEHASKRVAVQCKDEDLRDEVAASARRILQAIAPLPLQMSLHAASLPSSAAAPAGASEPSLDT